MYIEYYIKTDIIYPSKHITFYLQMAVGACTCDFVDLIAFDKNPQNMIHCRTLLPTSLITAYRQCLLTTSFGLRRYKIALELVFLVDMCPHLQIPHTHI